MPTPPPTTPPPASPPSATPPPARSPQRSTRAYGGPRRLLGEPIGPRGAGLLGIVAVAGVALALTRPAGTSLTSASTSLTGAASATSPTAPSTGTSSAPAPSTPAPSTGTSSTPAPSTGTSSTPAPSASIGPLLSSTPYAAYADPIYPGALSATTRTALAGFTVSLVHQGTNVRLTLNMAGSTQPAAVRTVPASDHIYFVEANLGDDSGSSEYNLGDDGLVITNASGHVVG
ncbi:MAG: hypothetical protein ACYCYA_07830 [Actinomycetes bacterium]